MRQIKIAIASVFMLMPVSHIAEAGAITYSIQNYPADQQGAALSGTITTDGVIGNVAAADVLSWSWTITPFEGTPVTLSSSTGGAVEIVGAVVASQSSFTIAMAPQGDINFISFSGFGDLSLAYDRDNRTQDGSVFNVYSGDPGAAPWVTDNPVMGGTDPWVIAEAGAVPEPSSLALASLGAASGIAFGLARKRRTEGPNDSSSATPG